MLSWLRSRWKEIGEAWRECLHVDPPGYRLGAVPTTDEMAARCREVEALASRLLIERDRLQEQVAKQVARVAGPAYLTPGETARLLELMDAGAKVVRAGTKALEWGYGEARKSNGEVYSTRLAVVQALGDFQAAIARMDAARDVSWYAIQRRRGQRLGGTETTPTEVTAVAGGEQAR